jgi:CHAT domain-containing protein/uncharacterized protein HemY
MSLQPLSLEQEAVHESTSCDRLKELAKISTELAQLVAKNPIAPSELLQELSESNDAITRQNVAANPNTPTEVLLNLGSEFPEQLLNNPLFSLLWLENPNLLDEMPRTTVLSLFKHESVSVFFLEWAVNQLDSQAKSAAEENLCDVMTANWNFWVQLGLAVAMNAQTPKSLLEKLVQSQYVEVRKTAQLHTNIAGEMTSGWDEAAREAIGTTTFTDPLARGFSQYIENLERRGLIPDFVHEELESHKDNNIRSIVTCNPNNPIMLERSVQEQSNHVLERVISILRVSLKLLYHYVSNWHFSSVGKNPRNLSLSPPHPTISPGATASNPDTPLNLLEQLAQHENYFVREAVAKNPNTPAKLLEQLAQDKQCPIIREFIVEHPNAPVSLVLEITLNRYPQDSFFSLSRFLVLLHPQAPAKALAENSRSLVWLERYAIAQNSNTPADTLKALALDANRIVRAAAKANFLNHKSTGADDAEQLCQQTVQQEQSGQLLAVIEYWKQALTIYRDSGHRQFEANTLEGLDKTYDALSEYQQVIEFDRQELIIRQEIDNRSGEAKCLNNLGIDDCDLANLLLEQGNQQFQTRQFQAAFQSWHQALMLYKAIGHRQGESEALKTLGDACLSLREYQRAIQCYQKCLPIFQEIGDLAWEGGTLCNLGIVHKDLGQYQQAIDYFQQAISILQKAGHREFEANSLASLGSTYSQINQYQQSIEYYQQSLTLYREIGNRKREVAVLKDLGQAYRCLDQYQQAIEYLQQSLSISREIGERRAEAASLNSLGNAYHYLGQHQQAIEFYQKALTILQEIGDCSEQAISLVGLGLTYKSLGQYQQAIEYHQQTVAIARELGYRSREANSLVNLGAAFDSLGQHLRAIELYEQALAIAREIDECSCEANALANLGIAFSNLGQSQEAIQFHQQSLVIKQEIGARRGEANSLNSLGVNYRELGQYQQAIKYYQQSLVICREIGYRSGVVHILINLGNAFESLGQHQQSINYYQQSLKISRELGERQTEAQSLRSLGINFSFLEQYQEQIKCCQESLSIFREIGDLSGEAGCLNSLGHIFSFLGQHLQAMNYYQQSLSIFRKIGNLYGEAICLMNLGAQYDSLEQYQQALEHSQQGLDIARQIGHCEVEAKALWNLGYTYKSLGQYEKAVEFFQQCIAVIEFIQGDLKIEEFKASFAAKQINFYERLIALLWQEARFEEAFNYMERSRARAFLAQFANGPINFRTGVSAELLEREEVLKAQIAALRTQLNQLLTQERSLQHQIAALRTQLVKLRSHPSDQLDTEAIASMQKQLLTLEKDYTNLLTELKLQSPESASLVSVDVATLDEIQSLLDADTTLVEYFVSGDLILAFIITRESFQTIRIEVSWEDLTKKIEAFRGFGLKNLRNPHPKSLQQLYQWLIAPLKSQLNTSQLAIVPHGVLHYLPFAALSTGERYLCDDYTLITLPSASILRFLPQKRKPSTGTLLALGNPTTPLPSLPSAEKEVNAIASLYGTQPLIGEAATESAVFSQSETAEILHLSAHGEFNKHSPLFSTLHLAADEQHDGRLEVQDIYALDLTKATNLVVLSACQTQLGELSRGDEVVGLNRAFLYAGTPGVIATLWSVQDDTTALLMERFYTHLRSGIAPAQALRQAQIEVRAKYPHPFYWAAFVLTGDGGSASSLGID